MSKFNNRTVRELERLEFYDPELKRALGLLLDEGISRKMAVFMIERATIARRKAHVIFPELDIEPPDWFILGTEERLYGLGMFIPYADRIVDFAKWYIKDFSRGPVFEEVMTYWWDNFDEDCFAVFSFLEETHPDRPSYRQYIRGEMFLSLTDRRDKRAGVDNCLIGRHNVFEAEALLTGVPGESLPNYAQLERYRATPAPLRDAIWSPSSHHLNLPRHYPRRQYPRADIPQWRLLARGYVPRDLYPDFTAKEAHDFLTKTDGEGVKLLSDHSHGHLEWFAKRHGVTQLRSVRAMRWLSLLRTRDTFRQFSQPSGNEPPFNVPMGYRLDEIQDSHIVRLSDTPKTVFSRVDAAIREAYSESALSDPELHAPLTTLPDWCSKLPEGFWALNTTYELRHEGKSMHHCVGSYSESTRRRHSLCLAVLTPVGRSTMEVTFDGRRCMQNKGSRNTIGAPEHLDALRAATGLSFEVGLSWSGADHDGDLLHNDWLSRFQAATEGIQAAMAGFPNRQSISPVLVPTMPPVPPEQSQARALALATRLGEVYGLTLATNPLRPE